MYNYIEGSKNMLNFTVGPVQSSEKVRAIGAEQIPYFRTPEFSKVMLDNERLVKKFAFAADDARALFITGSGTASMEAAIMNLFTENDHVLVVNGGSFGQRLVEICEIHDITYTELKLHHGEKLAEERLRETIVPSMTGLLVNLHETSTGVHYDIEMISRLCKEHNLFLLVDSISSFLCDRFNMKELGVGAMITGSQKALACPPGVSIIILSKDGIKRVEANNVKSLYFDLNRALKDGERGQTPFTPAVGTLLMLNERLRQIDECGVETEIERVKALAEDFRNRIKDLPFKIVSESLSNAVTPLSPTNGTSAYSIFECLKDEYQIWVCPNGGDMKEMIFRVGHIGDLTPKDNKVLVDALLDMQNRGLL